MALEIYWTTRANKKFDSILEYLLSEWNVKISKNFVKKVFDFLDILTEFPELGTLENEKKNIRGFTLIKQINVFYTVREDKIILLDFFDNRQNPDKKRF